MVKITTRRPKRGGWESAAVDEHGRSLLVAMSPHNIIIRAKGRRAEYAFPISEIYLRAVHAYVADMKKRNAAERAAAKGKKVTRRASVTRGRV